MSAGIGAPVEHICCACFTHNDSPCCNEGHPTLTLIRGETVTDVKTPATVTRVPNKPKTPVSNFRIPEDLKAKAVAKAKARGETLTDVVVRALERYVKRP